MCRWHSSLAVGDDGVARCLGSVDWACLCSVIVLALAMERSRALYRTCIMPAGFLEQVRRYCVIWQGCRDALIFALAFGDQHA